MKKVYKNQLALHLLNHPLGINNFELYQADDYWRVTYFPFEGIFKYFFNQSEDSLDYFSAEAVNYSPSIDVQPRIDPRNPQHFSLVLDDFAGWLNEDVQRFVEDEQEVDLWEEYQKRGNVSILNTEDFSDFAFFTKGEINTIRLGLDEIKLLIVTRFEANEQQLGNVNKRIDYLRDGLDRLNKTDYKGIFINTIISIMIALSLDTAKGQELFNLFLQVVQFAPGLGN